MPHCCSHATQTVTCSRCQQCVPCITTCCNSKPSNGLAWVHIQAHAHTLIYTIYMVLHMHTHFYIYMVNYIWTHWDTSSPCIDLFHYYACYSSWCMQTMRSPCWWFILFMYLLFIIYYLFINLFIYLFIIIPLKNLTFVAKNPKENTKWPLTQKNYKFSFHFSKSLNSASYHKAVYLLKGKMIYTLKLWLKNKLLDCEL